MSDVPDPSAPEPAGRRGRTAAIAVGVVAGLAVIGAGLALRDTGPDRAGADAADALVAAYARYLDGTYRVEGEMVRTLDDGRTLSSAYLVVQRPPDRLRRALGSTSGEVGGRTVNCSTPAGGEYTCAASSEAEPWEEDRRVVLEALDTYVRGDDPVYEVTERPDGCFELVRRRTEPDASFGQRAELCFDQRTGALRRLEVRRDGPATDVMTAIVVTGEVVDADFDLGADATYDPDVPEDTGATPTTAPQEPPP